MGGATEAEGVGGDPRLTERRNPRTRTIDRADPREIVSLLLAEESRVPAAVAREADAIAELVRRVVGRIRAGGRLLYLGAGTSGRLGVLDAAECPPTFGTDPRTVRGILAGAPEALWRSVEGAEDDAEAGRAAVRSAGVGASDLVLGIASSGTTPFVIAGLEEARALGAATAFVSCTEPSDRVRAIADLLVTPLVGPEVVAGSTRLKAGTATKLVLNAITTGTMIRLGKVYENLMVDLRAVSAKLVDRSLRIVVEAGTVAPAEARRLLVLAGGSAKTAIAMAHLGTDRAGAERALDACDGFLGAALERFGDGPIPRYVGYPEAEDPSSLELLVRRLGEGPEALRRAISAAAEASNETLVPLPSGGDRDRHLDHLVTFERTVVRAAVEDADSGESPPRAGTVRKTAADASLEAFARERGRTLALLPAPTEAGWKRRVRVEDEEPTLYQFLRGVAHHDSAHAARIGERVHRELLAGLDATAS